MVILHLTQLKSLWLNYAKGVFMQPQQNLGSVPPPVTPDNNQPSSPSPAQPGSGQNLPLKKNRNKKLQIILLAVFVFQLFELCEPHLFVVVCVFFLLLCVSFLLVFLFL